MKIAFEWEWTLAGTIKSIDLAIRSLICGIRGHVWEEYFEPYRAEFTFLLLPKIKKQTHQCSRCYKPKYQYTNPVLRTHGKSVNWKKVSKKSKKGINKK